MHLETLKNQNLIIFLNTNISDISDFEVKLIIDIFIKSISKMF